MKKRLLSLALVLVMALGLPAPAFAAKANDLSGLPGHEILALLPNTLRRPPRPTCVEQVGFQIGLTDSRNQWTLSQSIDDVFQEVVDLTDSLTAGKTTDTQKVKAIFDWVSENVKYDKRRSRGESGGPLYTYATKRGVCWDYASLSEVMCTIAEIPAAFIDGMSSSSDQPSGGHAWNAAFADGRWIFFDATWRLWDMAPDYHDHTGDFDCYDGVLELAGHAKVDGSAGELILRRRRGFECPAILTVPSYGVTTLDGFHGCPNLTEIIFTDTVTTIGTGAFSGCTGLTELTFPDSMTTIGAQAFLNCTGLKRVTIPDSVTTLEDGVFMGCSGLTEMTIPSRVPTVASALFYECTGLERVTIPNGVAAIENHAFMGCTSLTDVTIPGSAATIGTQAFYGCTGLESVTISEGVATIEQLAFFGCTNLKKADLPDSITSIDGTAFIECPNLPRRTTIPAGVTEIEAFAFQDNTALTDMVIPDHVTKIGYRSFYGCSNLARVIIPSSVTSIDLYAFHSCSSLKSVTIPAGITSIEAQTFGWCTGLQSVTLPDSVTSIGENAFSACTSLKNIIIPAGVTSIGKQAFIKCTSLTDVIIPSGVTAIEEGTFMNCAGLKSVTIPAGVTRIGVWAFDNCTSLKDVYYTGSEAQWKAIQIDTSYDSNAPLQSAAIHYNSPVPKIPAAPKTGFSDVPAGAYYEDAVKWAVEQSITNGTSATTFSPDVTCTTAQILTLLWRAKGSPEPAPGYSFQDISSGDYFYKAALWAKEKGLVTGDAFHGDTPCTRSSTVTYLWKLAGSPAVTGANFTDVPAGADYAQAVAWAVENGVTTGTGGGAFSPHIICSRGQIVTFLHRDLAK